LPDRTLVYADEYEERLEEYEERRTKEQVRGTPANSGDDT
jgi:hypothetical protein